MLFSQNKLKQAFDILSQVTHDGDQREEAIKLIEIIKIKINEIIIAFSNFFKISPKDMIIIEKI